MTAINQYVNRFSSAAPLVVFRICFGIMIAASMLRFAAKGWIDSLYIKPTYFFSFYGFEWVKPLGIYTYGLFILCAVAAIFVALGLFYRMASITLFLSFTYIELMDKSTYLNHYYFISLLCLLLIFLPANRYFSVDTFRHKNKLTSLIPQWNIDVLKLMMAVLYFYAGLAKVNSDWLLHALPLKIWLPSRNDMPLIGWLFNYEATAYVFSWFGCIYDLSIPFLLWNKKTRPFAYLAVIVFHVLTALLFPIGMFPHIMMVAALIFFSATFHQKIISVLCNLFHKKMPEEETIPTAAASRVYKGFFIVFFTIQLLLPWRYLCYPGELFWTEEGYRFSWRVMLMEKAGYAQFTVCDDDGKKIVVNNNEFLTPLQEKMMSTQPDMILQFAHLLRDHFATKGFAKPRVYVDSYVALNGRMGRPYIDGSVDLVSIHDSFKHKPWILPFEDEIKGF